MSDQEREKLPNESDDSEESAEDVEAHVKGGRLASDEEDGGDDVEAHVKSAR